MSAWSIEKRKEYYQKNKERLKEASRKFYREHKEVHKARVLRSKEKYPDKVKECYMNYHAKHKEAISEYNKEYYKANKERITTQRLQKRLNVIKGL